MRTVRFLLLAALLALPSAVPAADELMMATTANTQDSGLLEYLKPFVLQETGIALKWVSAGSGNALELGKNCKVDVLFMQDPDFELKMVEEGIVVDRREIMYTIEGDPGRINQYSVMTVNPAKCPKAKAGLAKKLTEWWVCPPTQKRIAAFRLEGKQLFFPNAAPPSR